MNTPKTLNAIRLNLILSNVTTKALHSKLEQILKQRDLNNPNNIKEFLNRKYDEYKNNRTQSIQSILKPLLEKLNPHHPRGNPNSPNELKSFDVSACFFIAKNFLNLSSRDLQSYDELREIRNKYIAHLGFLCIEDSIYISQLEALKRITREFTNFDLTLQKQYLKEIEEIELIQDLVCFKPNDIKEHFKFVINLFNANKEVFFNFEEIKTDITKLTDQLQENLIQNNLKISSDILEEFRKTFNLIQQNRRDDNEIVLKAIEELGIEELNEKLDKIDHKVSSLENKFENKFDSIDNCMSSIVSSLEILPNTSKFSEKSQKNFPSIIRIFRF